jgi:MSHA biogenesis protein MshJ
MKLRLPHPGGRADASTAPARLAGLATRGRSLLRQFNQRSARERLLLTGAGAALVLMLADSLWLGPALQAHKAARAAQASALQLQQGLQADIGQLRSRSAALARQQQDALLQWRQRLREGDAALREHEASLVGPERMLDLLEQLLARHGEVRVRALRSLGRSDLLATTNTTNTTPAVAAAAPAAAAASAAAAGGLYRHGVELVLEGGYADLLGYLKAMEALPQRVLWGAASLKVEQHPRTVLTVQVYTLSRDPNWLEL